MNYLNPAIIDGLSEEFIGSTPTNPAMLRAELGMFDEMKRENLDTPAMMGVK